MEKNDCRVEHTDTLSCRTLSVSGRNLYLHCTGNGFRSGFHGKSNRRKRKIQTANLLQMSKEMLCSALSHIFQSKKKNVSKWKYTEGRKKLCTITQDNELHLLRAEAGKQTDIEIDFRKTEIRVFVKVLPWGEVEQETEM